MRYERVNSLEVRYQVAASDGIIASDAGVHITYKFDDGWWEECCRRVHQSLQSANATLTVLQTRR